MVAEAGSSKYFNKEDNGMIPGGFLERLEQILINEGGNFVEIKICIKRG